MNLRLLTPGVCATLLVAVVVLESIAQDVGERAALTDAERRQSPAVEIAPPAVDANAQDLRRLALPDDHAAAAAVLHRWLIDRGLECQQHPSNAVVLRRGEFLINVIPLTYPHQIDRLRFLCVHLAKDEYRGSDELAKAAYEANAAQNLCQVFLQEDGNLAVGSNLTFYDEFTTQEFDSFLDLYVTVIRHVIKREGLFILLD